MVNRVDEHGPCLTSLEESFDVWSRELWNRVRAENQRYAFRQRQTVQAVLGYRILGSRHLFPDLEARHDLGPRPFKASALKLAPHLLPGCQSMLPSFNGCPVVSCCSPITLSVVRIRGPYFVEGWYGWMDIEQSKR